MKRHLLLAGSAVIGLGLALGYSTKADADLPVIDTAALGQWAQQLSNDVKSYGTQLQQWATQNLQWLKQVQQYATQVQQYANELTMLENWVHNPTLGEVGSLLNIAGLQNSLPINSGAVFGLLQGSASFTSGGITAITGKLGQLSSIINTSYSANHIYTPSSTNWTSQQLTANANSIAGEQGLAAVTYDDLVNHANAINGMRTLLNADSSPKDVADASAQIQLESVWTQNEAAKLQAASAIYSAQRDSREQQANEQLAKDLDAFTGDTTP
jgi:Type IV secretion system proteins